MAGPAPGSERPFRVDAAFSRTAYATRTGSLASFLEATRRLAASQLARLRGTLGEVAVAERWATTDEVARMADALAAWREGPDAFYARCFYHAIGWA